MMFEPNKIICSSIFSTNWAGSVTSLVVDAERGDMEERVFVDCKNDKPCQHRNQASLPVACIRSVQLFSVVSKFLRTITEKSRAGGGVFEFLHEEENMSAEGGGGEMPFVVSNGTHF